MARKTNAEIAHELEWKYIQKMNKEKDKALEDYLWYKLSWIYDYDGVLKPIFIEKRSHYDPILCALSATADLYIFILVRDSYAVDIVNQIQKDHKRFKDMSYNDLNLLAKTKSKIDKDLLDIYKEQFPSEQKATESCVNRKQKIIVVDSAYMISKLGSKKSWKSKGIDIDALPYEFDPLNEEGSLEIGFPCLRHRMK